MNASVVALQIALGLGMVAMAVSVLFLRNLMASAVSLAGFSLLLALEFYILQAPDVAIAEAGIGAGLTTAIFMVAIRAVTAKGKKMVAPAAPQEPESPKPEIPAASPAPAAPPRRRGAARCRPPRGSASGGRFQRAPHGRSCRRGAAGCRPRGGRTCGGACRRTRGI